MARLAAFNPAVTTLEESIARAKAAERLGYESVWTTQMPDARDASLVLAAYAQHTERVKLVVVVVQNDLNAGRHVSWALSINGIDVARFRVNSGVTGTLIPTASFAPIHGPNYSFKIRVTNDVPQGEGSISLAYACYTHGIAVS